MDKHTLKLIDLVLNERQKEELDLVIRKFLTEKMYEIQDEARRSFLAREHLEFSDDKD